MLCLQTRSQNDVNETIGNLPNQVPETVGDLMKRLARDSVWIRPDELISDVLAKLEFEDVGALVVSTKGHRIEGIISERDVVRGMRYYGAEVLDLQVAVLMQDNVIVCRVNDTVQHAAQLMQNHHIRHLPAVDGSKLVGVVSLRDVLPGAPLLI